MRKRVIKILRDICLEYPGYDRIPEMCVKMIRRVKDEEGIRKLVMEVFQNMWFQPVRESRRTQEEEELLVTRCRNITDVIVACTNDGSGASGLGWFEDLLMTVGQLNVHFLSHHLHNILILVLQLFRPREDKEDATKKNTDAPPQLVLACQQIVDCLVESVLSIEETSIKGDTEQGKTLGSSNRIVACLTTLYLFAKIRPQLLVEHVQTLQPYLQVQCKTPGDFQIISNVARTLELAVPLIKHPSEIFLSQLEEDSVKLILKHDKKVISSCVSCLGSIVNSVTKNFKLIRDCFSKYYEHMVKFRKHYEEYPEDPRLTQAAPVFRRALFTVSLLLRYFDFSKPEVYDGLPSGNDTVLEVFENVFFFMRHEQDAIQLDTLHALGSICIRHYNFMLESKLKELYLEILQHDFYSVGHKIKV